MWYEMYLKFKGKVWRRLLANRSELNPTTEAVLFMLDFLA